ncbi:ABC transporter ATP-binding protein [Paracraurococcus lichenis]|uniref:ABC transporter ATP-binding protein n=1 Tax=Paracraurococcus lichenis TaxID=3064888 RepID=A0ABT9E945_9PROT|nr:ABC transporter ATP-binding protein [Paracraurococcus sp. LOR1-02]MDO9712705.1 ABC transporter ATP-binding protein [Paracraurococcus sp. LOR1-02]
MPPQQLMEPMATTAPAGRPALTVSGLRAYYQVAHFGVRREVRAVDGIDLNVAKDEIYGLAGESSSGKSSLIKTIARAIRPPLNHVGGSVVFDFKGIGERSLYDLAPAELVAIRWRNLSYVMQASMSVLNPVRRVRHSFRDFAFPHMDLAEPAFWQTVEAHLERLHLPASVLGAYPHELSGGMRQRVTIALATVCRPDFVIMDEPTTALDVVVQKGVLGMIREVQREIGSSVLFVTHDMAVHANLTDRLGIMYAGRIVEEGRTPDVFRAPRHPYTRHLIASLPRIGDRAPKSGLEGKPPNLAAPPPGCRFHPRCPLVREICRRESPPLDPIAPDHRVACHAAQPGGWA